MSSSLRDIIRQSTNQSIKNKLEQYNNQKFLIHNDYLKNNKNYMNDLIIYNQSFSVTFTLFTWGVFFLYKYLKNNS